ncbi:MAG TPA: peptide deformylase [Myxococcales bacterium]
MTDAPVTEPVAEIVQTGDPVLREPAHEIDPAGIGSRQFQELIEVMVRTMRAAPGVGLAAPQIGVPLRVFVMEDPAEYLADLGAEELAERERTPLSLRVWVNPVLKPIGEEKVGFFEGCLSVAGFVAYVERYREVEVSGLDERGQPQTMRARGWPARILQHEFDHLEGTLYIDRMFSRSFAEAALYQQRFSGKRIAEVRALLGVP